jgi:Trk K+ transport system NAD-binding subunit
LFQIGKLYQYLIGTLPNYLYLCRTQQKLNLKKHLLVAGIIRKGVLITPSGQDVIKEGDNVIIVTLEEGLDDLRDILEN